MQQANDTNTKRRKKFQARSGKKTLQKTFFTLVLTKAREIPKKIEGKNPDKMCCDLSENIPTATEKNNTKILYIFTGNVKPYIQIHI